MAIEDIDELYEEYVELDSYRAFLFTPSDVFAGELDLMEPSLSLKKDGFDLLDFRLSARLFDFNTTDLSENPFIDSTLDGYYIIFEFGDLTTSNYQERRFIIKGRVANLQDDQVTHSYSAISAEHELKKLPIINWPGIQVKEYKDVNGENSDGTSRAALQAIEQVEVEGVAVADPKLLNDSTGDYQPIKLKYTPKDGNILVFRVHKEYKVEVPLFETSRALNQLESMSLNEYFYNRGTNEVILWVPAHLSVAVSPDPTQNRFNEIEDELYDLFIYYEPVEEIEDSDIVEGEFEKAYFNNTDGLTINQILEDLFQILENEEGSLQYFIRWQYDKENSHVSDEIRSEINFSNTTVYDMLKSLEENYQLYIDFDTITRKITVRERLFGTNNGLRFEYGKYLLSVSQDYNTDEIVTYVQGQDANGVGFADVSWSGDNYIENYDYYLDGVTWTPEGGLVGVSRWMTSELAEVLAQIKYYQDFYEDEVWGNELEGAAKRKGLANIRFKLQEQLNEIDFKVIEVEKEIELKKAVLDAYLSETPLKKASMDKGVKRIPNNLVTKDLVGGTTHESSIDATVPAAEKFITVNRFITENRADVTFKAFTLITPQPFFKPLLNNNFSLETQAFENFVSGKDSTTRIKITFKNALDEVVKIINTSFGSVGLRPIPILETIVASKYEIFISMEELVDPNNRFTNPSFTLTKMSTFSEAELAVSFYTWPTYDIYIKALIVDLEAKKTILQIEQEAIKYGTRLKFDPELEINESDVVEINEPNLDKIGIGQLELRLEEIQTYTSIDHDALEPAVLDELKAFRKGAVYSNNDIRNSKTLFVAARNELEEIIFPMITIDIASVSILQTYEGFEDWGKVRIGEKVDIFVPQLKISIEAEIVELGMNFQDYSTSVKISTVRNYDKSFGRIFSNVFLLGNKTSKNEVLPLQKPTERAKEFLNDNSKNISDLSGSSMVVGVGGSNNSLQFDNMDIASSFVDTVTDTLTTTPPLYYTEQEIAARGTAQITNGGLYIKDAEGEVRIKMNALEGLVGFKTDGGVTTESFKIDLEGNAIFAGELKAARGTFGNVSIAEDGNLTVGNIIINNDGVVAVDENDQETFNLNADGSLKIKGSLEIARSLFVYIATLAAGSNYSVKSINYQGSDEARSSLFSIINGTTSSFNAITGEINPNGDAIPITFPGFPEDVVISLDLIKETLILDDVEKNTFRALPQQITYTFLGGNTLTFTISAQDGQKGEFQNKTITFIATGRTDVSDLLEIALAGAGTESAVTSVNGQIGDVTLDVSRKGNKTFLQTEQPTEGLIEGDIWFHQGDE